MFPNARLSGQRNGSVCLQKRRQLRAMAVAGPRFGVNDAGGLASIALHRRIKDQLPKLVRIAGASGVLGIRGH